jgi:5,5'-dehydrodivanillate O-demethylase
MDASQTRSHGKGMDFTQAGPDTPGGRFLRQFWQPVFVSDKLAIGRPVPILIMGELFTLYRGDSGAAYVVGARCAHRNTQLSTGWVKGDSLQCLYHGWTYDGSGQCVERPAELPSGPCASVRIPAYPTREHLGLIYAYFGSGEPPAFPPFPTFEGEGVVDNRFYNYPCNWFQSWENHLDEVHVAFTHRRGGTHRVLGREVEPPETAVEETDYGMVRHTSAPNGKTRVTHFIFPNTMRVFLPPTNGLFGAGGWRDSYVTLVPSDDENHLLFMTQQVRVTGAEAEAYLKARERYYARLAASPIPRDVGRDILAGKLSLDDVLDHPNLATIEDVCAQLGQGPIHDRSKEYLGRTDMCIVRMRRLFERELRALAEGRPTKAWRYSGEAPQMTDPVERAGEAAY